MDSSWKFFHAKSIWPLKCHVSIASLGTRAGVDHRGSSANIWEAGFQGLGKGNKKYTDSLRSCAVDGYCPFTMALLWTSHCCFHIFFLVSSLMCIELLRLSGQILFHGTFLSRIYSRSIPAFLHTGTQSTPVTAVIQCQIKHYTFLLVRTERQFENFSYKTEMCQLFGTQGTFSCFYPVESVLPGLTLSSLHEYSLSLSLGNCFHQVKGMS